ncbi:MAG: cell division protein ZapA [Treponema sp.]|jgi:cell division protein ZapA (FtsZ GTPase activity inhibitor)|nr:cell division protein ZapA [Treponema sp.]
MQGKLRLDILGASFSITADEDSAYLEEILERYRKAIANTQKTTGLEDPLETAILTGFMLCDDIHKLQNRSGGFNPEAEAAEHLTLSLIDRISEFLENTPSLPEDPPQSGSTSRE